MRKYSASSLRFALFLVLVFPVVAPRVAGAQRERQVAPPEQGEYGKKFFEQLRNLFGRFRDADLQRAFQTAQPIQCADLISGNGEWRTVAFFNENRKLGDWYHSSLEEVKGDLSVYTFKGSCNSDRSSVQLVTKFPVKDSLERYSAGRIHFEEIAVNVNAAVRASFDPRTEAYAFQLPYLYAVQERNSTDILYSLVATHSTDRYVTDVTNQWDCKAVRADDVTFQFLICDTQTLPRILDPRNRTRPSFGSAAYFILSDGKEASTSVKLSFGTPGSEEKPPANPEPPASPASAASKDDSADRAQAAAPDAPFSGGWQIPNSDFTLAEVDKGEFRILFSPQTWANKIGSSQVLSDQKMSNLDQTKTPTGVDYCTWRPASASLAPRVLSGQPDLDIAYSLTTSDGNRLSPVSISFDMKTLNGSRLGTLQCFFPRAQSPTSVSFDRWVAVVGAHLTLETHP